MKNAIFGRESKFHDPTKKESVQSEKHFHPEYEGAAVPLTTTTGTGLVGTGLVGNTGTGILGNTGTGLVGNTGTGLVGNTVLETTTTTVTPMVGTSTFVEKDVLTTGALAQEEVLVENRERPAVIHEKVYQVEREEIQPIIHREREQTEILQVEAPMYEREIRPTIIHEKQLAAEIRPNLVGSNREAELQYAEFGRLHQSTLERAPIEHRVFEKPAIVEEHIRKTVIEEIQPIDHK